MIAAIYARKSTEQNGVSAEAKSVTRQIDHCRAYAVRKGWTVADDRVYADDGISGAEFAARPGFLRLMNAVASKPRPFDVLVMSEESRLGRESIETAYALKQIIRAGCRVFFYLEDRERTLETPTDKLLMSVTAFADELEREKARQRVTDAMMQKAHAGHVCGGRVFGYNNVTISTPDGRRSHVERRINDAEAAIVRELFERAAAGAGLKRLAIALNRAGAVSPRAQQGRPSGWAPTSIRAVLWRDLYRGRVVWNRTKKRDAWGQHHQTKRAAGEWITVEAPELRIVPEALWLAAHRQLETRRASYLGANKGSPFGRPPCGSTTKYLLSGLSRCGVCGGGFIVRSRAHGRTGVRSFRYGCYCNWTRGRAVCANRDEVLMATADQAVLALIEREVLNSGVIEGALDEAVRLLATESDDGAHRCDLERQMNACDRELSNLLALAAAGGNVPALAAELQDRQRRREGLAADLAAVRAPRAPVNVAGLRAALARQLDDWRGLAARAPQEARGVIERMLSGRIVFTPTTGANGQRAYSVRVPLALDRVFESELPIGLASPSTPSWNQIMVWLRDMAALRETGIDAA